MPLKMNKFFILYKWCLEDAKEEVIVNFKAISTC